MEKENNIFLSVSDNLSAGLRLDQFLSSKLGLSRSQVQRLIKNGNVAIDDQELTDCAYKTKISDVFEVEIPDPQEPEPQAQNIDIDIVYNDADLMVINKKAGMVVHPGAGVYDGTLVNAVLYHAKGQLSGIGGVKRPGIVHRIDKETSGLLVVAKNDFAHLELSNQFAEHSVKRTYFALVYGVPNPLTGTIEGNIGRSKFDRKKMAVLQNGGKHAVTHYKTLEVFENAVSLISCRLETGRTHQIRVHMSSIGNHLIGDKLYTSPKKSALRLEPSLKAAVNNFDRQALHAATLGFIHPKTKQELFFEAPIPEDMSSLIQKLHHISY